RDLLGTVGASDADVGAVRGTLHAHEPRVAADLAVLHEAAAHVLFDVDLDLLATVRARDEEGVQSVPARHRFALLVRFSARNSPDFPPMTTSRSPSPSMSRTAIWSPPPALLP